MSTITEALIVNGAVLFAVLEADLGSHRRIGWFRLARPLLLSAAIIPLFVQAVATHGTGLTLEIAGLAGGVVLGLLALGLMKIYRSPRTGTAVSRAGLGYAALWIIVIGARSAFSYGSEHWFRNQLGTWMFEHDVTSAAITDTLIVMAIAMVVTRTLGMALRANAVRHDAPVSRLSHSVLG